MWPDRGNYPDAAPCQAYDVQPANDDCDPDEADALARERLDLELAAIMDLVGALRDAGADHETIVAAFAERRAQDRGRR